MVEYGLGQSMAGKSGEDRLEWSMPTWDSDVVWRSCRCSCVLPRQDRKDVARLQVESI